MFWLFSCSLGRNCCCPTQIFVLAFYERLPSKESNRDIALGKRQNWNWLWNKDSISLFIISQKRRVGDREWAGKVLPKQRNLISLSLLSNKIWELAMICIWIILAILLDFKLPTLLFLLFIFKKNRVFLLPLSLSLSLTQSLSFLNKFFFKTIFFFRAQFLEPLDDQRIHLLW